MLSFSTPYDVAWPYIQLQEPLCGFITLSANMLNYEYGDVNVIPAKCQFI